MNNKASEYNLVISQIKAITSGETDIVANMANISSVLFNGLPDISWAGFYLYKENQLVLGPFQGKPACLRIPMGVGVCGKAIAEKKIQVIENVHDFEGHIACDAEANSEVVIPVLKDGNLIAVLDVDSKLVARFNQVDADFLVSIVNILIDTLD